MHRTAPGRSFAAVSLSVILMAGVIAAVGSPASASPAWSVSPTPSPRWPAGRRAERRWRARPRRAVLRSATAFNAPSTTFPIREPAADRSALERDDVDRGHDSDAEPGTSRVTLGGVACTSASNCFAVGYGLGRGTLVEQWNGSSWSIVASPNPGGSTRPGWAACRVRARRIASRSARATVSACDDADRAVERVELVDRLQSEPDRCERRSPERRVVRERDELLRGRSAATVGGVGSRSRRGTGRAGRSLRSANPVGVDEQPVERSVVHERDRAVSPSGRRPSRPVEHWSSSGTVRAGRP